MNIKPLYDKVLIRRELAEERTAGGIIIPDTSKEKPSRGIVIAVGDGARNEKGEIIPMSVKINDRVLFTQWGGNEVKISDEDLLIVKESDILGILE